MNLGQWWAISYLERKILLTCNCTHIYIEYYICPFVSLSLSLSLSLRSIWIHFCISGQPEFVTGLSIVNLLPSNTLHYLTYEGSLTQPSCYENVNWIILNKPIYISNHDLNIIKNSINGYGDNFRPIQPIARRCIRTNIDFNPNLQAASSSSSTSSSSFNKVSSLSSNAVNSIDGKFESEHSNRNGRACSINRFATYKSLARVTSSNSHSTNSIGLWERRKKEEEENVTIFSPTDTFHLPCFSYSNVHVTVIFTKRPLPRPSLASPLTYDTHKKKKWKKGESPFMIKDADALVRVKVFHFILHLYSSPSFTPFISD